MFMMFASLRVDDKAMIVDLHVVCEFPNMFPYHISDMPLEREVDFSLDLVPGTRHVLMALYRMYASELNGLKK